MKDMVNRDTGLPRLEWRDFPQSRKNIYEFIFKDFLNYSTIPWQNTIYRNYVVECCNDYDEIGAYKDHKYLLSLAPVSLKNAWRDYSRADKPNDFDFNKRYEVKIRFKRILKNRMRFTHIEVISVEEDTEKFKKALIKQILSERLEE